MKTLRLRDTQHLAARNSTAEVTAVISTLKAGRDPGGWLGTPVTRQAGLGAEKALHTQDQRAGVRVTALAATRTGSCHRTGPRNGNTATPGPSGPRHGARGAAPRRVWVTRPPVWPRPRVTSAPRAQCRARPTQTTAAPGRNGHAPPHAPPRGTHPPGRPRHTARRGSWAQRASSAPSPSEGLPPAVGGQGRAVSGPDENSASRLREAPLRPCSQTPELPAARRRVRGQLVSCWFRLLELGNCAAAVTESGGPWDECAWR